MTRYRPLSQLVEEITKGLELPMVHAVFNAHAVHIRLCPSPAPQPDWDTARLHDFVVEELHIPLLSNAILLVRSNILTFCQRAPVHRLIPFSPSRRRP